MKNATPNAGFLGAARMPIAIVFLTTMIAAALFLTNPSATQASSAPRIVEDGITITNPWNVDEPTWQAWLTRPPGDDTHGAGDLFVIAVTFDQPIKVHDHASFKIEVGNTTQSLVRGAVDGKTAYFGTTVSQWWRDNDGIRIGDGSETLAHNLPDHIEHKTTGVDAILTHAAVGTFPNHKANGRISRPNVTSTQILGPECDDLYHRDEHVTVKVTFDQPVAVRGTPQAVLKIRGADRQWRVRADYAEGAGTNSVYLKYQVVATDAEPDGVRMDANAMLIKRDRGRVPLNRAKIVGQKGGLMADLRTRGVARSATAPVDGTKRLRTHCETTLPAGPVGAAWSWAAPQPTSSSYRVDFTVHTSPPISTNSTTTTLVLGRFLLNDFRFVMGLSNNSFIDQDPSRRTKAAFCSSWDHRTDALAQPGPQGWAVKPTGVPGRPILIAVPFDWPPGDYTMLLTIRSGQSGSLGTTWACNLIHHTTDEDGTPRSYVYRIGSFFFSQQDGQHATIDPNLRGFGTSVFYSGSGRIRPKDLPVVSATVERPKLQGLRRPKYTTIFYSTPNPDVDNGRAVYNSSDSSVTITAGGDTSHADIDNHGQRHSDGSRR